MFSVLMIDVINSKSYSIDDRQELQEGLLASCQTLNEAFLAYILKKVDFSAGDELQGLFNDPGAAFLYLRSLMMLFPKMIRAGIGIGEWEIKISGEGSSAQDGSAYHRAREAINLASKHKGFPAVVVSHDNRWDRVANEMLRASLSNLTAASRNGLEVMKVTQVISPILAGHQGRDAYMDFAMKSYGEKAGHILRWAGKYPVYAGNFSGHLLSEDGQWGLQSDIAEALHTHRQAVQRSMNTWNIMAERQQSIAMYQLFDFLEDTV